MKPIICWESYSDGCELFPTKCWMGYVVPNAIYVHIAQRENGLFEGCIKDIRGGLPYDASTWRHRELFDCTTFDGCIYKFQNYAINNL